LLTEEEKKEGEEEEVEELPLSEEGLEKGSERPLLRLRPLRGT